MYEMVQYKIVGLIRINTNSYVPGKIALAYLNE